MGDLQTELVTDFFEGFARGARANVHVKTMYGRSNHHKIEAMFKAFARALRVACSRDKQLGEMLPRTKGLLVMRVTVDRLQSRQSHLGAQGAAHLGAEVVVTDQTISLIESAERSSFPGSAISRRRGASTMPALPEPIRASDRARHAVSGHLRRDAVALSGSTEAPEQPGLGAFSECLRAFSRLRSEGAARRLELARVRNGSRLLAGVEPGEFVYFTHSYRAPVDRRHGGSYELYRAIRRGGGARQRDGRAVSSGEIRRGRPQILRNFLAICDADQAHHRVPRRPRRPRGEGRAVCGSRGRGRSGELAARHAREGADEIVLLDITATHEGRQTLLDTVRRTAREMFVPFTVGGGIRSARGCGRRVRRGRGQGQHQFRRTSPIPS